MNRILKVVWCFLFATMLPMASAQAGAFDLYYWTDATADHQVGNYLNWDADYHSGASHTSPADAVPGDGNIAIVALPDSTAEINPTSNFAGGIVNELYVGEGTASGWPFTPVPGEGHLVVNDATFSVRFWMTLGRVGASGTSTVELNGGILHDVDGGGNNAVGENATATITLNELVKMVGEDEVRVQSEWNTRSWTIVGWNAGANGLVTLNNASTWNCVANDITMGYFGAADNPSTAANGVVTLNDASVLDMMGHGIVIGAENGSGTVNLNGTSTLKANWLNTWSHASSTSTLNFDGGTLVTTADSGNFYAQNGAGLARIHVMENGANINTDGHDVAIYVPLLDGDGQGGGLTKLGEGTLTLGGACTYAGDTLVDQGELSVMGSVGGEVTVLDSATLMGAGTIDGNIVALTGGNVAPGASIGTLTVTGNATINGTLDVEYDGDAGTIDQLAVSGDLDLTGATLSFSNLGETALSGGPYVFATYGTLTGMLTTTEVDVPIGFSVDYAYGGNSIALIPEPTMVILFAGLALALAGRRKRQ